jgi:hypothetical protein
MGGLKQRVLMACPAQRVRVAALAHGRLPGTRPGSRGSGSGVRLWSLPGSVPLPPQLGWWQQGWLMRLWLGPWGPEPLPARLLVGRLAGAESASHSGGLVRPRGVDTKQMVRRPGCRPPLPAVASGPSRAVPSSRGRRRLPVRPAGWARPPQTVCLQRRTGVEKLVPHVAEDGCVAHQRLCLPVGEAEDVHGGENDIVCCPGDAARQREADGGQDPKPRVGCRGAGEAALFRPSPTGAEQSLQAPCDGAR